MIYAMSDIHGCLRELKDKMTQVDLQGDNRLIFLGDYMDYGIKIPAVTAAGILPKPFYILP